MRVSLQPATAFSTAASTSSAATRFDESVLRRSLLISAAVLAGSPLVQRAIALDTSETLADERFLYSLSYPSGWNPTQKPVKTHLSEALLNSPRKGVSLGVTVDPVKIDSLEAFGTPEEVADRVLTVEEGRDGVLDVQLRSLAADAGKPSYYTIEYFVESTRGKKVYLCKYCIAQKRLYVLQTQAKVVDYDDAASDVQQQLRAIVASFRVSVPS